MAADEQGQVLYGYGFGNGAHLATFRYPLGGGPGTLLGSAWEEDAPPPGNSVVYDADGGRLLALAWVSHAWGYNARVVEVALPSGAISIVAQIDTEICSSTDSTSLAMAKGALVVGCTLGGVVSMSLATKEFTQLATFDYQPTVAAHPSSSTVYVRDFDSGDLYSLPLEGGAKPLLVRSAWAPYGTSMHFSGDGQYLYALGQSNRVSPPDYVQALVRLDLHTNESVTVGTAGAGFVSYDENATEWECGFTEDFAVVGTKVFLPCQNDNVRSSGDAFVQEFKCLSFGG
jgi:hypothetical protein